MKNTNSSKSDYLMPNDKDQSWGIVTTTIGSQNIFSGSGYPTPEHPDNYLFTNKKGRILNEYQLVYISEGKGVFSSASQKEIQINAGTAFLLFPNEWHKYKPDENTGWHESWIGFSGKNMDNRILAGFFTPDKPIFNIGIQDDVLNIFKQALNVSKNKDLGYQQVLAGLVNLLLGMIFTLNKKETSIDSDIQNQINRTKIFMQENLNDKINFEDIASMVGMSYSKFRNTFKNYTGFAPAQYLLELRINKAKDLLSGTSLSCQQIAFEIGMETPSYFNHIFKNKVSMTPNQYRRKYKNSKLYF